MLLDCNTEVNNWDLFYKDISDKINDYKSMNFISTIIQNSKTNEKYSFVPASLLNPKGHFYESITKVCNEELVYKNLFEEMCNGKPYTLENAEGFISWTIESFKSGAQFPFFIIDKHGHPVGTVGIKNNDPNNGEIGYWLSAKHSGLMTNAVVELSNQAKNNGFKKLYALCSPKNIPSQNVLIRASFQDSGILIEDGKEYIKFEKSIL